MNRFSKNIDPFIGWFKVHVLRGKPLNAVGLGLAGGFLWMIGVIFMLAVILKGGIFIISTVGGYIVSLGYIELSWWFFVVVSVLFVGLLVYFCKKTVDFIRIFGKRYRDVG